MPAMVPDFHTETGWQMKKQIVRVSPVQSAKVAAIIYLVTSMPLVLLMLVPNMVAGQIFPGFSIGALILMPVLYTAFGFIFTLIAAGIYNLVASRVGGFEFTTAEVGGG